MLAEVAFPGGLPIIQVSQFNAPPIRPRNVVEEEGLLVFTTAIFRDSIFIPQPMRHQHVHDAFITLSG